MKSAIAAMAVLLMTSAAFAQNGSLTGIYKYTYGKYHKGTLVFVETKDGNAQFTLYSDTYIVPVEDDLGVCFVGESEMQDGEWKDKPKLATKINDTKYVFKEKHEGQNEASTIIFDFSKNESVTVTSENCTLFYCVTEGGDIDGTYKKTSDKASFK